jgi:hypothetical protein
VLLDKSVWLPVPAVEPMVCQRLVGPVPGDQAPSAGVAEARALVDFAPACARDQILFSSLGLHAVKKPVGAPRRARQHRQLGVQSIEVCPLPLAFDGGVVDQVFGMYLVAYLIARSA